MNRLIFSTPFLCLLLSLSPSLAQDTSTGDSAKKDGLTPTPTATVEASAAKKPKEFKTASKGLEIHKPLLPSAWGHLIQYKKEQILALSEKSRETLHEFVLQDDQGIVRIAVFHENASGEGYWEVTVWDQP